MMARYDARNLDTLRRMVAPRTQLQAFPWMVMEAACKASFGEMAAQDEDFRTPYARWKPFLDSSKNRFRAGEATLEAFRCGNAIPAC